jgi:hypothetical protein
LICNYVGPWLRELCDQLLVFPESLFLYAFVGPWLLELFDQLYWTADQLQLRQLATLDKHEKNNV